MSETGQNEGVAADAAAPSPSGSSPVPGLAASHSVTNATLPDGSTLAIRVAALRQSSGWSLQQLADKAGITKAHAWELETGKSANPTIGTVEGLARAFSVTPQWLAFGVPTEVPQIVAYLRQQAAGWLKFGDTALSNALNGAAIMVERRDYLAEAEGRHD